MCRMIIFPAERHLEIETGPLISGIQKDVGALLTLPPGYSVGGPGLHSMLGQSELKPCVS